MVQNYLIIESNVVTNICVWDGSSATWTPPANSTMLIQSETKAMVWKPIVSDNVVTGWQLVEELGQGQIGFTWDGERLTTNLPKPEIQPIPL